MHGSVYAVCHSNTHSFSKQPQTSIELLAGLGVAGDAHMGATVKHRSRVARDPSQPNLRQVHLLQSELFAELRHKGFHITAGAIGENITTQGLDLLELPTHTRFYLGAAAVIELTGLRNPCGQLNGIQPGLQAAVLEHDEAGNLIRRAGVMAIVLHSGTVAPGDVIRVELPAPPYQRLERV